MYKVLQRLGYSHCDSKGRVTLVSIMNMLQDIGGYFSEDFNLGENYLHDNDLGWIVYNWNIDIIREANIYDSSSLEIGTLVYEYKGSICNRYYEIRNNKNELLIKAFATWVLIRYSTGHPVRLTEVILNAVKHDNDRNEVSYKIEKCKLPDEVPVEPEIAGQVPLSYIDIRGHMNNARYLEFIQELLEGYKIRKIYINYQIPLFYKQKFIVKKYFSDKNIFIEFSVRNDHGNINSACVMKFETDEDRRKRSDEKESAEE